MVCQDYIKPPKKNPTSNLNSAVSIDEFHLSCSKLFSHLPKPTLTRIPSCLNTTQVLTQPFSVEEISSTLKNLRSKAPSKDGFSPYHLKLAASYITPCITKTFNSILQSRSFPCHWLESCLFFIYKKGNQNDPNNYRSIAS